MQETEQDQAKVIRLAPALEKVESKKHQVKFDDFVYDLKVKPTPCGVDVAFVRELSEEEKKNTNPIIVMLGRASNELVSDHIHPRWWWSLVGRTVEGEIEKFVKRIQKDAENYAKNKEAAKRYLQ